MQNRRKGDKVIDLYRKPQIIVQRPKRTVGDGVVRETNYLLIVPDWWLVRVSFPRLQLWWWLTKLVFTKTEWFERDDCEGF